MGDVAGCSSRGRFCAYDVVRVVVGLVLLTAAALKAHQLATEPVTETAWLDSRWVLLGSIELEFLLGLLLLSGRCATLAWCAALLCFASFSGISLFKAVSGEPNCGCFGQLHESPWLTLIVDLAAVVMLAVWRPIKPERGPLTARPLVESARRSLVASILSPGVAATAGFAAVAALGLIAAQTRVAANASALTLAADGLDLGDVWPQRRFPWTVHLHNPSLQDVTVREMKSSCPCISVVPRAFTVRPGDSVAVRLTLDLWRVAELTRATGAPLPFALDLQPVVEGRGPQSPWRLRGRIRPYPLVISPKTVDFGEICGADGPNDYEMVRVACREPAVSATAACENPVARVTSEPASDGNGIVLRISLQPGLSSGEHRAEISIKPICCADSSAVGDPLPEYRLPVCVKVLGDIYLEPSEVAFGAIPMGQEAESTVAVCSASGRLPEVLRVATEPRGAIKAQRGIERQELVAYRLIQRAVAPGAQRGEVRFLVRAAGDGKEHQLLLPVSYHGVEKKQ